MGCKLWWDQKTWVNKLPEPSSVLRHEEEVKVPS
jgi:hypothetical protein